MRRETEVYLMTMGKSGDSLRLKSVLMTSTARKRLKSDVPDTRLSIRTDKKIDLEVGSYVLHILVPLTPGMGVRFRSQS